MYCKRLERLSIKSTAWYTRFKNLDTLVPLSRELIVKFVRYTPTLRRLRSDLTEENVAALPQEHPYITFVTELEACCLFKSPLARQPDRRPSVLHMKNGKEGLVDRIYENLVLHFSLW
jgi:hypothetical protein